MRFTVFYTDAEEGHKSLRSTIVDARSETRALALVRESGFRGVHVTIRPPPSSYPQPRAYEARAIQKG
jgi:hypothetical protein